MIETQEIAASCSNRGAAGVADGTATTHRIRIGLLTGADDRSYALGLTAALVAHGVHVDFVGSDKLDAPELHNSPLVRFLNLRGDQREDVSFVRKALRLSAYYFRLLRYAAVAEPKIFHILWNNKFELFDRTALMLYYRALGRKLVFTAHNVNAAKRDSRDGLVNRLSLLAQYSLAHHILVHTEKMKRELVADFRLPEKKVSVIPFGINTTVPSTRTSPRQARMQLRLRPAGPVALFFGQVAPYKGLEYLIAALPALLQSIPGFHLIVAGKVKRGSEAYWESIKRQLGVGRLWDSVTARMEHIPDEEVEVYFKAADVLVIPYTHIFQSGVPFLAYHFGLPVIASDVGSLTDDVIEGRTGFICRPRDSLDLARVIREYFSSELYGQLPLRRIEINRYANERYSWTTVGSITRSVYASLTENRG